METKQLEIWRGKFGKAYTDRNIISPEEKKQIFKKILCGLKLSQVLEVGCNRGHNLVAIAELFKNVEPVGIEPNDYARKLARQRDPRISVLRGTILICRLRTTFLI